MGDCLRCCLAPISEGFGLLQGDKTKLTIPNTLNKKNWKPKTKNSKSKPTIALDIYISHWVRLQCWCWNNQRVAKKKRPRKERKIETHYPSLVKKHKKMSAEAGRAVRLPSCEVPSSGSPETRPHLKESNAYLKNPGRLVASRKWTHFETQNCISREHAMKTNSGWGNVSSISFCQQHVQHTARIKEMILWRKCSKWPRSL